jgi:phasin family protein
MTTPPNPFADFTKMFEQFKLPGMDMSALMESRRKDIEALGEANKLAYEGMQALIQKQTEIFGEAMHQIQSAAQQMSTGSNPAEAMAQQNEFVQKALHQALENMRELAEMARKSQADAMAVIGNRAQQNLQEAGALLKPKSS